MKNRDSLVYLRFISCQINLSLSPVVRHLVLPEPHLHLLHVLLYLKQLAAGKAPGNKILVLLVEGFIILTLQMFQSYQCA